jgi:hypothetical protein
MNYIKPYSFVNRRIYTGINPQDITCKENPDISSYFFNLILQRSISITFVHPNTL